MAARTGEDRPKAAAAEDASVKGLFSTMHGATITLCNSRGVKLFRFSSSTGPHASSMMQQ